MRRGRTRERFAGKVEPVRPEVYNFRFSAGKDFKEKLERLAEVLGVGNATQRMPELIERALDLALERKDPKRKLERRRKREARTGSAGVPPASSSPRLNEATPAPRARSRYIPSAVRERVVERASYQCEFCGPDGTRCAARAGLEIDHVWPYGKGGSSGEGNLRVFCRVRNLFAASREFGSEFIRRRIREAGCAVPSSG